MTEKPVLPLVLSGLLLLASVAFGIFTFVMYFVGIFTAERPPLYSGQIIVMEQSGTFNIYLEDNRPPERINRIFTFTNTATGEPIFSRLPTITAGYNIGSVSGIRIASAELPAGEFRVDFEPHTGSGHFVQGFDFVRPMLEMFLRLGVASLVGMVSVTLTIIFAVKLYKFNKTNKYVY